MKTKVERQYRYPPEVCNMHKIASVMIGRTLEETAALSIIALYRTVCEKGNVWGSAATDEELIREIMSHLRDSPEVARIVQQRLSTYSSI